MRPRPCVRLAQAANSGVGYCHLVAPLAIPGPPSTMVCQSRGCEFTQDGADSVCRSAAAGQRSACTGSGRSSS
jgi:hypothetical protein